MDGAEPAAVSPWLPAKRRRTAWSATDGADLRGPFDIAVAATAVLAGSGVVIGWSPAAEALLGHRAEEVVGRPAGVFLEPAPTPVGPAGSGPAPGPDAVAGRTARHADGRAVPVVVLDCPLTGGGPAARILVIEEARRAREARSRQAMLHGLATQSPLGLAIYDTDLRLSWANAAHDHEVGRPLAEYRGRPAEQLYPDGAFQTVGGPRTLNEVMRRVVDSGESYLDLHFLAKLPSDPRRDHLWSCSYYRLQDEDGTVLGVCEDAFDITDRHEAQSRLSLLAEAGRRIGITLDVPATAQAIADVAVPDFADDVTVDVVRAVVEGGEPLHGPTAGHDLIRVASRSRHPEPPGPRTVAPDGGAAYPEGSPQLRSLSSGGRVLDDTTLVVPLRSGGRTMGLVSYRRAAGPRTFDGDEVALADELTARAALGIDNARRYTRERTAALTLQRELLPEYLPPQSAVDVAHRYLPADDLTGVGGDWFDVIPLSGARVGLVVGDVVGHGLAAAATMGRLRTTVEALATLDMAPDELLTRLDDLVGRTQEAHPQPAPSDGAGPAGGTGTPGGAAGPHPEVTTGATCLYAVYDPVSRHCTMARAGHLPPAIVHPDGSCTFPELPPGPPLGLGGLPFEAREFDLPVGSLLALFTDGLVESRSHDIEQGLDTLARVLCGRAGAGLEELCDRAVAELRPPGTTPDDTALLLVRTKALDEDRVAAWDLPAEPAAAGRARELVTARLETWGLPELAFSCELVVSELVTNAVRYAEGPLQLRLIRDRTLLCEVADAGHTSPHLRHSTIDDEGGRGLFIVAQLVSRWGTRYTPSGKTIWTEQAFPTGTRPASDAA
ncbi:SpoIIE family protein phosphatase [Streptomyces genisteinicus]|uniref:SpoIIE family protein phosphatase n=1 Tax=Streptomyces genisteinicus TaxID=2768068 RepID=A0A7H0HML2_9ACTN|nr:SpoIIE family protein phosphatase [Streptomyces genisteinicus]QNP61778.1 SpoIIE family protein phosphatase [Streptomyces genisteinicus]